MPVYKDAVSGLKSRAEELTFFIHRHDVLQEVNSDLFIRWNIIAYVNRQKVVDFALAPMRKSVKSTAMNGGGTY